MRYLAMFLLGPWLLILGWAYYVYPKNLPCTRMRRSFDWGVLILAAFGTVGCAALGFKTARVPGDSTYGQISGAIWQQILPALYGYGCFISILALAMGLRYLIWRRAH